MHEFALIFSDVVNEINNYIELFEQLGSGWQLEKVNGCDIRMGLMPHIAGGCCISVPDWIKKALYN